MPRIERLTVYPVKSLDGQDVETASLTTGGTLVGDRLYALYGPDDELVNGKRTARVHDLDTDFDLASETLHVAVDDDAPPRAGERRSFDLEAEREAAQAWLSEVFETEVTLRRDASGGLVDRPASGPSVLSTATLRAVAGWYDDVTVPGLRRRLRANVEVAGVEPFWEDRFVGEGAPAFEAGDVRLTGVEPCGRCVVPERDPDTGERDPTFRERFVERRRETLPDWADVEAFEHCYEVMLIAAVPEAHRDGTLRVGDEVSTAD